MFAKGRSGQAACRQTGKPAAPKAAAPALLHLFDRLEEQFDGSPSLLILDEAWLFLDSPIFAARIREWLKTLRKKNVSVIFATQSLADIKDSSIAPAIIESCPTRIFLPNERAVGSGKLRVISMGFLVEDEATARALAMALAPAGS